MNLLVAMILGMFLMIDKGRPADVEGKWERIYEQPRENGDNLRNKFLYIDGDSFNFSVEVPVGSFDNDFNHGTYKIDDSKEKNTSIFFVFLSRVKTIR